jgi:hypothetical protein
MKKLITLLLLFTLVGFLSGNQVVITNDYEYIVSEGKTYNFNNGSESNNVKYDRTNKIAIQNNKIIADPLKYHYAFFWDEVDSFIGYYKTNKGITTSGEYLGQVNTQSIPLPLNAYSFALVRYDNDYVLVNGFTIEELFIDNNLASVDPDDFNDIPIAELNGLTLNEVFNGGLVNTYVTGSGTALGITFDRTGTPDLITANGTATNTLGVNIYDTLNTSSTYYFRHRYISGTHSRSFSAGATTIIATANMQINNSDKFTNASIVRLDHINGTVSNNYNFSFYLYNLTTLGLTSLTKSQLDTYYNIYENGVNATYYATDGNVSSLDGYYYAAGKNLVDLNGTFTTNTNIALYTFDVLPNTSYTLNYKYIGSGGLVPKIFVVGNNVNPLGHAYYGDSQLDFDVLTFDNTLRSINNPFLSNNNTQITIRFRTNGSSATFTLSEFQVELTPFTSYETFATPTTTLNLTFLFGVGNEPDKATMDGYYAEYEQYLEYLYVCCNIFETQTISFETIYFDDGVSTEIEQLGSILIFTLIGFTLMIFGFASKRRIFNLLAVGAFVVLGFLLIEFVGFIIILFGLIFVNVYYTFFGEL